MALAHQGTTEAYFYAGLDAYATAQNVPEPSSFALALIGLVGAVWFSRRRVK